MRKATPFAVLLALACTTATPPPATPPPAPELSAGVHGFTVEEEARLLQLEDRREFDPALVAKWVAHPNVLHRVRIAQSLGRIGGATFFDRNKNGEKEVFEKQAGVEELIVLARDPEANVRSAVAFSLGEIGEPTSVPTLYGLTADHDSTVAAEAAEALSKFGTEDIYDRYSWMTGDKWPEGVRVRALRYLFRFPNDNAMVPTLAALGSPSSSVRQAAAYALARKAYPSAQAQLELLLNDQDVLTRAYAAQALGRIGNPDSAPLLLTSMGDSHPWVRTNAVIALARVFDKNPRLPHAEDLPRIRAILDDADPGTRASAIDTLGYYARTNATAKEWLLRLQHDGSRWEREIAAGTIVKHLQDAGYVFLAYDTDWAKVRIAEATPFGGTGGLPTRAQLAKDPSPMVRAIAVRSIPDTHVNLESVVIKTALEDPDVTVRAAGVDRYGLTSVDPLDDKIARLKAVEVKERTAEMNDARVAAIEAIAAIPKNDLYNYLKPFLADPDPVVRRVAAESIEKKVRRSRPQYTPLPTRYTDAEYRQIAEWSRQPHTATIHMTRGVVQLALLTQDAPMTTWNFVQLAKKKYFDKTIFMRVVPNFVVQGGDPRNDQNGGPGYVIRDEINQQRYTRGAVGMALSGPDTGGSQFFVTHSPQPHLDGGYTVFARVYEGMGGVVDQTERGDLVETITIDEHSLVTPTALTAVQATPLPTELGPLTIERILMLPEYTQRRSEYKPDITVIEMLKSYVRARDRVEVYMGTWCDDSQREVPKYLRILDDLQSQFGVQLPTTYVAVDRAKAKPAELLAGKAIEKVATFIYYRGETELGRIVEKPNGLFEDDLLAIAGKQ